MGWLSGWKTRIKLTISNANVDAELSDFPVSIYLSASSGTGSKDVSAIFDELALDANRKKIAITSDDGTTELYVEIELWEDATEKAWLWVKVPTVANGAVTDLYLYFDSDHADNDTYIGDTGEAAAQEVWDDNFLAVWHMAENPNGDPNDAMKDSTGNGHHGTPDGDMTTADVVLGKVAKGTDFDGIDDMMGMGDVLDFDKDDPLTLEVITNADEGEATIFVIAKEDNYVNAAGYHITYSSAGAAQFSLRSDQSTDIITVVGTVNVRGSWHYIAATYDGSLANTGLNMYKNGAPDSETRSGGPLSNSTLTNELFQFGCREGCTSNHFIGILDEVRVSDIARSAAWIKATYYSNWDGLVAFGDVEVPFKAEAGSYALTGADVGLIYGLDYVLEADGGSYALTGTAVTFLRDYVVGAGAGGYTLAGAVALLLRTYPLFPDGGSYALTGTEAILEHLVVLILLTSLIAQEIELDSEMKASVALTSLLAQEINLDSYLVK